MQAYQYGSMEWIKTELAGLLGQQVTADLNDIVRLYSLYDGDGQSWTPNVEGLDYKPTVKRTNLIKKLIKDEARYMMSNEPEIKLVASDGKANDAVSAVENWLTDLLKRERWQDKLLKAARDCFIGKRVALKLTGGPQQQLGLQFRPSLEFVFDTDAENVDKLSKIVFFYQQNESTDRDKQRIWRQRYEMVGGRCLLTEGVYDGYGNIIEQPHGQEDTGLDFIPAFVIINDGLTGDMTGESDVQELWDDQDTYNRFKSDDIDALRFNMFPMRVFRDASQETMDNLKISPGATIDAQTDPASATQVDAKILEAQFGYNDRLENALNRVKGDMYDLVSVPLVTPDQLKGFITSGKGMKALYWNLTTRCEEKWNAWDAALRWMVDALIKMAKTYKLATLPDVEYTVNIDHRYPIPDDEETERMNDMSEVSQQVRSRKSYLEKWSPDADSDAELRQIVAEQGMLGDQYEAAITAETGEAQAPVSRLEMDGLTDTPDAPPNA